MFEVLFAGFFVIMFAYSLYEVRDIPLLARIFPFWISLIALVLSIVQLALEARRSLTARRSRGPGFTDLAPDGSPGPGTVYARALHYAAWLPGLYLAIWLVGFVVAMALFIFSFLRWEATKGWRSCAVMSLFSALFLVLVSWMMTLYWPEGVLGQALGLPWPLR